MYHRTVQEWEKQRHRLEMDYGELKSRVNYLSDEVFGSSSYVQDSQPNSFTAP